jgi:hypothetical protein
MNTPLNKSLGVSRKLNRIFKTYRLQGRKKDEPETIPHDLDPAKTLPPEWVDIYDKVTDMVD